MINLPREFNQIYSYINSLQLIELAKLDLLILMTLIDFAGTVPDKLKLRAKGLNHS